MPFHTSSTANMCDQGRNKMDRKVPAKLRTGAQTDVAFLDDLGGNDSEYKRIKHSLESLDWNAKY